MPENEYRLPIWADSQLVGMRSYQRVRHILSKATERLTVLDTLLD